MTKSHQALETYYHESYPEPCLGLCCHSGVYGLYLIRMSDLRFCAWLLSSTTLCASESTSTVECSILMISIVPRISIVNLHVELCVI